MKAKKRLANPARETLRALVSTIDATGGVVESPNGYFRPVADEDWIDLGDVYAKACRVLRRPMKVRVENDDVEGG